MLPIVVFGLVQTFINFRPLLNIRKNHAIKTVESKVFANWQCPACRLSARFRVQNFSIRRMRQKQEDFSKPTKFGFFEKIGSPKTCMIFANVKTWLAKKLLIRFGVEKQLFDVSLLKNGFFKVFSFEALWQ